MEKFSAFINFKNKKKGMMEFSNSVKRLQKLILAPTVVKVTIFEKSGKKLQTLKNKTHK